MQSLTKRHTHYQTIAKLISFTHSKNTGEELLQEFCDIECISELELQNIIKEWGGVSVKPFLYYLYKENAQRKLAEHLGISSALQNKSKQLRKLHITHESITQEEYKKELAFEISYGVFSCMFGFCLLAITERGVCKLAFFDNKSEKEILLSELREEWPSDNIYYNQTMAQPYFEQIFNEKNLSTKPIHLLLKGTPFQLQVWHGLLSVPAGQLSTYSQMAEFIKKPKAVRAIASAIANNQIAYLIPCHRVIRKTGELSEYRWGKERKAAMILIELS